MVSSVLKHLKMLESYVNVDEALIFEMFCLVCQTFTANYLKEVQGYIVDNIQRQRSEKHFT